MRFFDVKHIAGIVAVEMGPTLDVADIDFLKKQVSSSTIEQRIKDEFILFLSTIDTPRNLVFYHWVVANNELLLALTKDELHSFDISSKLFYIHSEKNNFFHFLTPFLFPILNRKRRTKKMSDLYLVLFYSQLMNDVKKVELQSKIKQKFDDFIRKLEEEEDYSIAYNPQFIRSLNLFDRTFYSLRSTFVSVIGDTLTKPDFSLKEKQKIATAVRKLDLNDDHTLVLNSFIKKAGLIQVKTAISSNFKKKLIYAVVLLIGIGTLVYLFNRGVIARNDQVDVFIPPYGTDSLSEEQITYLNTVFKLELDTINSDTVRVGIDMEIFEKDSL